MPITDSFYGDLDQSTVKIIRGRENIGFPKACNKTVARSVSPLIFLLNDDVVMQPEALDKLVRVMDDPKIGVVGMKLLFPTEFPNLKPEIRPAGKVQHIGIHTNIRGEFLHSFIGWSSDNPKVNNQREVYAVTGAALMTRRSIWNKLRGLDEIYSPGNWEDVDYCLKVREIGYNVVVEPEAVATHYTGATSEKYNLYFPFEQNRLKFLQRWQDKMEWWEGRIL